MECHLPKASLDPIVLVQEGGDVAIGLPNATVGEWGCWGLSLFWGLGWRVQKWQRTPIMRRSPEYRYCIVYDRFKGKPIMYFVEEF
uniref:Uncharacterized protein n=1 Tax=Nelumbo nucifera TaxID=4432 RepID=A0A822XG31_NELNU|nr:TPA_asm: hypothetical protein HUJ06_020116 [Nelumbo nucifera]